MEKPEEENARHSASADALACFEAGATKLIHETKGLLTLLKSVKGLDDKGKDGQLYRITLKRFRDNCLKLAASMEACATLAGVGERDRILQKSGVTWDHEKNRVSFG